MYISYTPTIELREVNKFSRQFLFGDCFLNILLIAVNELSYENKFDVDHD